MAFALLAAGFETTAMLIGNGMSALLRHPDQLALLRTEPGRIDAAIEELLRYDTPVELASIRFAKTDVTVARAPVKAGDALLCAYASANRDLPESGDPESLGVRRPDARHLSFGHGAHFCIGAPLARLETRVAFQTLLTRCENLTLAVDPAELVRVPGLLGRRLVELPVTCTAREV